MRDWRVWVIAIVMGLVSVWFQFTYLSSRYILSRQVFVHQMFMRGEIGRPWQYRVLSEYLLQLGLDAADKAFPAGQGITLWNLKSIRGKPCNDQYILVDSPHFVQVCLGFRALQNVAILLLVGVYLGRLGIRGGGKYAGMAALAWGLFFAFSESDLQFNTYMDVALFLLAGIAIAGCSKGKAPIKIGISQGSTEGCRNILWVIPLSILGAMNRETSVFIPLLGLAWLWLHKGAKFITSGHQNSDGTTTLTVKGYPTVWTGIIALGAWGLVYGALVLAFPSGKWNTGVKAASYGWEIFRSNFRGIMPWANLAATLGPFPVLAAQRLIGGLRLKAVSEDQTTPQILGMMFWVLVPAWFGMMLFFGNVAETRLFLVPQAMVFIPLALKEGCRLKAVRLKDDGLKEIKEEG